MKSRAGPTATTRKPPSSAWLQRLAEVHTDGLPDAHAPGRTVTAAEMIHALARSSPCDSQGAIDTLVELVEPDGARDDIAILSAQVTAPPVAEDEGPSKRELLSSADLGAHVGARRV